MPCESCHCQFTVFKRKKPCTECKRLFCTNCLVKKRERIICERCLVFTKRPISKTELLALKPKDLIFFLQSKHISTDGCLEKEELVNLVMIHVNNSNSSRNHNQSDDSIFDDNITNPFDQIKQTCQNLFTSFSEKIAADLNFDTKAATSSSATVTVNQNISNQPRSSAAIPLNNIYSNSCSSSSASSQIYSNIPQQPTNKNIPSNSTSTNTSSSGPASPISLDSNGSSANGGIRTNNIPTSPNHDLRNNIPSVHINKPKNKNHNIYDNSTTTTTTSGCECSDDETIHKFQNNYKKSSPGTSRQVDGLQNINPTTSIINDGGPDSSNTSSFEELGQAAGTSSDTDNWQFIQGCDEINSLKQDEPSTNSSIDLNTIPFTQHSATQLNSTGISPAKKLTRRRSDTFLNRATNNTTENDISDDAKETNFIGGEESSRKRSRTCCNKCGKSKNNLKKYVQRLRAKLDYSNTSEEEKREQLEAFLKFLENRNSLDISDDETEVMTTPIVQEEIIHIETPVIHIEPADFLAGMEGIHVYPVDEDDGNSEEERRRLNARAHSKLDEVSSK